MSEKVRGFEVVERLKGEDVKLPERSTKNSAGYDFFAYEDITIPSFVEDTLWMFDREADGFSRGNIKPVCIKTGIKAYMQDDEVLEVFVRSSAPSKLSLVLANSVGIIDSDYYGNPDNDGEIGFLVYNVSTKAVHIKKGDKLGQGIFTKFLKIDDDSAVGDRTGGFGSTGV